MSLGGGPSQKNDDPHNDPSSTEEWSQSARSALVCYAGSVSKAAEGYVHLEGIRLHGAVISSGLNFSGVVLRFPLVLNRCRFTDDIKLVSAELAFLNLSGSFAKAIWADRLNAKGNVLLRDRFTANAEVSLWALIYTVLLTVMVDL